MNFASLNLNKIEYVKITYLDTYNNKYEIKTLLKKAESTYLVLEYRNNTPIKANCPQYILAKFVTNEAMYIAQVKLVNITGHARYSDFDITKPVEIERRQKREYCRVNTEDAVVVTCIDAMNRTTKFLAKSLDLSAGGVKLTYLKSLQDGKRIENIDFKSYAHIYVTLYFDAHSPITFSATFIRCDNADDICSYAFEYKDSNTTLVDTVAKFVSEKLMQARKEQKN